MISNVNQALEKEPEIAFFPNPTAGELNIDLKKYHEKVDVEVYNSIGQNLHRSSHLRTVYIKFQFQGEPGVYFVNLSTNEKSQVFKLMRSN